MMINRQINTLINVFIKNQIVNDADRVYYINIVSGILKVEPDLEASLLESDVATLFNIIGEYAERENHFRKDEAIDYISSLLIPNPSAISQIFWHNFKVNSSLALEKFYAFSQKSYYIKYDRIEKNIEWLTKTKYGDLQLTINLSKPEKTPQEIKDALTGPSTSYPKCVICYENIGFFGNATKNSRQNIRFVNMKLNDTNFFMHFSPYSYFKQHVVINQKKHSNMIINKSTYKQLTDFVDLFPTYFIGSNSDIPIVGGSILSHLHYQGGLGDFPLFNSESIYKVEKDEGSLAILNWPLSTIKITSKKKDFILNASKKIMENWYKYENKKLNIIPTSNGNRQNAITPLMQFKNGFYHLYLILRNNGVSTEFPEGIFHVKEDVWNIKKENIGLIEAAGKAILPSRLCRELSIIALNIKNNSDSIPDSIEKHKEWYKELKTKWNGQDVTSFIHQEVGYKFLKGLEDCGVFKNHPKIFEDFLNKINYEIK